MRQPTSAAIATEENDDKTDVLGWAIFGSFASLGLIAAPFVIVLGFVAMVFGLVIDVLMAVVLVATAPFRARSPY